MQGSTTIGSGEVLALEERAMNAWPAPQTVVVAGWTIRIAGGCTKRANSANALAPSAGFETVRVEAERLYASQGLPAIFRLSPLAPGECDRALQASGYRRSDPSAVIVAPLHGRSAQTIVRAGVRAAVEIESRPSVDWLVGITQANGVADALRPMHETIVRSIVMPTAFATLHDNGVPIGFGLAVQERGMVGLFDIVIAPAARGRGHGRTLLQALMDWGYAGGARSAYLQVRSGNTTALGLYAGLGFTEAYRYHYRIAPHRLSAERTKKA